MIAPIIPVAEGFAPIVGDGARVLILGSLPGRRSLLEQQYYAHPQNSFWRIMAKIMDNDAGCPYQIRCRRLIKYRFALWDVLAASSRPGSLDSAIDMGSARANDFDSFLGQFPEIELICFNGKKARELFDHLVLKSVPAAAKCKLLTLPSTSPAYAAISFEDKLHRWWLIGGHRVSSPGDPQAHAS